MATGIAVMCACALGGIGTDAHAGDEPESRVEQAVCRGWRGVVPGAHGHGVKGVVTEATLGKEAILAGVFKGADGGGMAFVGSVVDSSFVSMTWRGALDATQAPLVLWSDGHCEHLEALEEARDAPLSGAAPWIWSSLPSGWQVLLPLVAQGQAGEPPLRIFMSSVGENLSGGEPGEAQPAAECSWDWSTEGAAPRVVQSQLESLASRYRSTLDRLQSVERLRGH